MTEPQARLRLEVLGQAVRSLSEAMQTDRGRVEPETGLRQNSIRHLSERYDGPVGFAMQCEGAPGAAPPLLELHPEGRMVGDEGFEPPTSSM